jgi:hypothetical protein
MYSLSCWSLRKEAIASLSSMVSLYILQLIIGGASSLRLMTWSSGRDGGKRLVASSENTTLCCWNWWGTSVRVWSFPSFSTHCWLMLTLFIYSFQLAHLIFQLLPVVVNLTGGPMIVLFFQSIWGANSSNQGYPNISRSFPRLVIKKTWALYFFSWRIFRMQ